MLLRSARAREPFPQLAGAGLALAIGLQAFINMGVALSVLPAKGMTLPLISYGGSAMLTAMFGFGLLMSAYVHREVEFGERRDEA